MSTHQESRESLIHAPYSFVPMARRVFLPAWADLVSQDHPFRDGLSGTLDLEIRTETPIFVRGAQDPKQFYQGPDGPALPGSSLRGAIRNVVEIASFGHMRRFNNHRYGVRDLNNRTLYVDHMAGMMYSLQGKKEPLPKVVAGWLEARQATNETNPDDPVVATITPCHFAKVHYSLTIGLANKLGFHKYQPGKRQSAVAKYATWGLDSGAAYSVASQFTVKAKVQALRKPMPEWLHTQFGKVVDLENGSPGRLVFTGQPSPWDPNVPGRAGGGNPKQHDFVFFDGAAGKPVPVPRSLMDDFAFIHADAAQQHSLNKARARNEEWDFWYRAFAQGGRVPVFFLLEGGRLRAFGLAQMFRLPYRYNVGDAVRNGQGDLVSEGGADLAELVFGHVPMTRKAQQTVNEPFLKGRVSFGLCRAVGRPVAMPPVQTVLGAPKASYYPSYVEQQPNRSPGSPPSGGKDHYKTFMDKDVHIRGFKRYRIQPSVVKGPPPPTRVDGSTNENVATVFSPLPAGTKFHGSLRFHNLRPAELGAVLWALDFGQDEGCRHSLGMARSLGYGRCTISVRSGRVIANDATDGHSFDALLSAARDAFVTTMTRHCKETKVPGAWEASRIIVELKGIATPVPSDSAHRQHMRLNAAGPSGRKVNQFSAGKVSGTALPSAVTDETWAKLADQLAPLASRTPGLGMPALAHHAGRPPTQQAQPMPWTRIQGGTKVQVELIGLNRSGSWRGRLVGADAAGRPPAEGTIVGTPPREVAVGEAVTVVVTQGGDPKNLGLKWG